MRLTKEYMEKEIKKERRLDSIRKGCFFVGIVCGVIAFSIAKIYPFAILMLALGIGMAYQDYSNKKQIELIVNRTKG